MNNKRRSKDHVIFLEGKSLLPFHERLTVYLNSMYLGRTITFQELVMIFRECTVMYTKIFDNARYNAVKAKICYLEDMKCMYEPFSHRFCMKDHMAETEYL